MSISMQQRHTGRKAMGLQSLLTLALDTDEWPPSCPCYFSPGYRKHITHWI